MIFRTLKLTALLSATFLACFLVSSPLAGTDPQAMTIKEALETAMQQNPNLRSATSQNEAAEAKIWEATSAFLPQVVAISGYTRSKEPNAIVPIHEIGVFPPLDDQIYEISAQVEFPLFNGGRTIAARRAAKASTKESMAQQDLTEMQLVESIARVYIQSQGSQEMKSLIIARVNVLKQRHREFHLLLQEGRVSPSNLALVASSLEAARADSLEVEFAYRQLAIRLGQLVGLSAPVQPTMSISHDPDKDSVSPETLEVGSDVVGPGVLKAQACLDRAEALYSQALRSFWPEIRGFGGYFLRSGSDLDMIDEWAVGIWIKLPVFAGGHRIANVRGARAYANAAEEAMQSSRQAQEAALHIAVEEWRSSSLRQTHLASAVEAKAQSIDAQRRMNKAGRIPLSELLTQETELLGLQFDERSAAYAVLLSILHYHAIAGTLTPNLAESIVRRAL